MPAGRHAPAGPFVLAALLALAACGSLPGFGPVAPEATRAPPAATGSDGAATPRAAAADDAAATDAAVVPDGRYAGLAILTAFHGDCNAGGTGEIVVHAGSATYRDALNPRMTGRLGPHGEVDISDGPVRLSGRFEAAVFTGRIAGGACAYQMRYERVPS